MILLLQPDSRYYDFSIDTIPNRLRILRKVSGAPISLICDILDVSPGEYLTFECGHNIFDLTAKQILALSYLYKVNTDFILGTSFRAERPRPKRNLHRSTFKEHFDLYFATLNKLEKETAD